MKKITYINNMPYEFNPKHSGAPYLVDGHYKNHGQWIESITKFHRGYEYVDCPATPYNMGSDIEEMNASVKSSNCSLASVYGPTKDVIMEIYFANVASTLWIYALDVENEITEYHMNKNEFLEFLQKFGTLATESGSKLLKIRIKKTSKIMIRWLEERVEE